MNVKLSWAARSTQGRGPSFQQRYAKDVVLVGAQIAPLPPFGVAIATGENRPPIVAGSRLFQDGTANRKTIRRPEFTNTFSNCPGPGAAGKYGTSAGFCEWERREFA